MMVTTLLFSAVVGCSLAYSLAGLIAITRTMRCIPKLRDLEPTPPARWPRVSLIVPARDEAEELEAAISSRLGEDYPDLEVIVIDDRSTDRTGAIADAIAARDARVVVEHVSVLPEGWLGKVHALHRGVARASGEWLLFSDADVHFAPGTLRRAIAWLEREGADHLSVMPEMRPRTFLVGVVQAVFLRLAAVGGRLPSVADPRSSAAVGGGLFNLVRRSALERTRGFEWLRLELIDDLALGQMLKANGARARVVNATGSIWLDFYPSVRELVRGGEKNSFALLGGLSYLRLAVVLGILLSLELGPCVALAWPGASWAVRGGAALALALITASGLLVNRWLGRRPREVLLWPMATVLLAFGGVRSAWLSLLRGGIVWRDTRYSIASLRAGRRVRFP
jgi:glycosyltransferase involved in cell wall biosynthesis